MYKHTHTHTVHMYCICKDIHMYMHKHPRKIHHIMNYIFKLFHYGMAAQKVFRGPQVWNHCCRLIEKTIDLFSLLQLTVIQCDISTVTADAVVHPTNSNLDFLGEVGQALSKAGGKEFVQEVRDLANGSGALQACDGKISLSVYIGL